MKDVSMIMGIDRMAGARYKGEGQTLFMVWAPAKEKMMLHLVSPAENFFPMPKDEWGYFTLELTDVYPGTRYFYRPDEENDYPDPASYFQPEGVHGPSEVVDLHHHTWTDGNWQGLPFSDLILYELHVGTFTAAGSFEAVIPCLDDLVATGINALELMPVSQFPGNRNWGYDAVYPYAVQNSYGGLSGLQKLVDACHHKGIAVFLDVVYNHLGPEGNYFSRFGPYFTGKYRTPWGDALNFDGEWSDGVRSYFSNNALFWFENFHVDGLRLDAIHSVFDSGAVHFWELTSRKVKDLEKKLGRSLYLMAESDLNSPRVVQSPEQGGYGFDAQWLDDFHHALYTLLDRKGRDRYIDFGQLSQLAKGYKEGFVHSGEWVRFRKRHFGTSSAGVPGNRFVVFNMNHDQVGNRVGGERLCMLVDEERVKLAAAAILLAPYVPMLFMGEEYADDTPFYYFVSHSDKELVGAVREGRKEEFKSYGFSVSPPDPQDEKTFLSSRIQWHKREEGVHKVILAWHKQLLSIRKSHAVFRNFNKADIEVYTLGEEAFMLCRQAAGEREKMTALFNLSEGPVGCRIPETIGSARKILDSQEETWCLPGRPRTLSPGEVKGGQQISLPGLSTVVYYEW